MKLRHMAAVAAGLSLVATPVLAAEKAAPTPIALPAPPAGKGQIVWFRPGGMGFAVGCSVNARPSLSWHLTAAVERARWPMLLACCMAD